ncbi:four helix bundle protein [Pontibacter beigongshangensis]|uniref:four helix bundle protein n=1 Tax=Pontibacter beigongshangensis TaxID=2574733 RepID=UPI001650A18C|nr:four helix bundle protein [Pontibacter beigongshangensis]
MNEIEQATNEQFAELFRQRTKRLAIDVIRFSKTLSKTEEAIIMKRQLLRASTSVAANYRAACRSRSSAEFYSKVSIVIEEADETLFWFELLEESETTTELEIASLKREATEILSVLAKARKTMANSTPRNK